MLFEFDTNIFNIDRETEIYDPKEGLTKGNMFPKLYNQYKDYKPATFVPKNEREALLDKIYMLCFAINDLNLYLDTHPNDEAAYNLFKKYCLMYEKCVNEYENKYQVLEVTHDTKGRYTWTQNPWPWEGYNV